MLEWSGPWRSPIDLKPSAGRGLSQVGVRQWPACRCPRNCLCLGGRSLPQKFVDVVHAKGVDECVDENVAGQRNSYVTCRERGCDRVPGAQQPVHDPGLAPDLGGVPAAEDGNEAGWEGEECSPEIPACRLQPSPKS